MHLALLRIRVHGLCKYFNSRQGHQGRSGRCSNRQIGARWSHKSPETNNSISPFEVTDNLEVTIVFIMHGPFLL